MTTVPFAGHDVSGEARDSHGRWSLSLAGGPDLPHDIDVHPVDDEAEALCRELLSFSARDPHMQQKLASLCGAPPGAGLLIDTALSAGRPYLRLKADAPGYTCTVFVNHPIPGSRRPLMTLARLDNESARSGRPGLAAFVQVVKAARVLGFQRFDLTAAKEGGFNGYYSWPRMGCEGQIASDLFGKLLPQFRRQLGESRSLRDLFELPGGPAEWRRVGSDTYCWFVTVDGSRCMDALAEYIRQRGMADFCRTSVLFAGKPKGRLRASRYRSGPNRGKPCLRDENDRAYPLSAGKAHDEVHDGAHHGAQGTEPQAQALDVAPQSTEARAQGAELPARLRTLAQAIDGYVRGDRLFDMLFPAGEAPRTEAARQAALRLEARAHADPRDRAADMRLCAEHRNLFLARLSAYLLPPSSHAVGLHDAGLSPAGRQTAQLVASFLGRVLARLPGEGQVPGAVAVTSPATRPGYTGYDVQTQTLTLPAHSQYEMAAVAHELGHHLEWHLPGARASALTFLGLRAAGEGVKRLCDIDPVRYRGDTSPCVVDRFMEALGPRGAYAGKFYLGDLPGGGQAAAATELLSMGMETLFSHPAHLSQDRQFTKWLLGMLDGTLRAPFAVAAFGRAISKEGDWKPYTRKDGTPGEYSEVTGARRKAKVDGTQNVGNTPTKTRSISMKPITVASRGELLSRFRPLPDGVGHGFSTREALPPEQSAGYRYERAGIHHNYHFTPVNWRMPLAPPPEKVTVLEGFAPNLNKHLHVGHLKNLAVASALSRILAPSRPVAMLGASQGVMSGAREALGGWFDFTGYRPDVTLDTELPAGLIPTSPGEGSYAGSQVWHGPKGPQVVVRSDGSHTYAYHDLAYAQTVKPDLYLTGSEQAGHFASLGLAEKHLPMGLVLGPDGTKLKSRDGSPLRADDALKMVEARLDTTPEPKKLAYNVLAMNFLMQDVASASKFDPVQMTSPASPGMAVSYTLARARRALDKAGVPPAGGSLPPGSELSPEDVALLGVASYRGYHLAQAAQKKSPAPLAQYAVRLARAISGAYAGRSVSGGTPGYRFAFAQAAAALEDSMKDLGLFTLRDV